MSAGRTSVSQPRVLYFPCSSFCVLLCHEPELPSSFMGGSTAPSIRSSQDTGILGCRPERWRAKTYSIEPRYRKCMEESLRRSCWGIAECQLRYHSNDISSSTSTPIVPLGSPHIQFTEDSLSRLSPLKSIFQLKEDQKTHLVLSSLTELANSTNYSRLKCDSLTQF